jgi:ferredoxin-NADP reductase
MAVEREGRLEATIDHGEDTRSLFLRLPTPLVFHPGQFVSCLIPSGGELLIRPYSIASDPAEADRLELLLNLVPGGPGSTHLLGLEPGATVRFTGPWGTFTLEQAPAAEVVFVADGTGIAPIRPMVHRAVATRTGGPLRLLHAIGPGRPPVYRPEFEQLARTQPGFSVEHVPAGTLEPTLRRRYLEADADRTRHFFICGVGASILVLRDLLRKGGYERRAVHYEKW